MRSRAWRIKKAEEKELSVPAELTAGKGAEPEISVLPDEYNQAVQADELVNNGLMLAQIGVSQMCRGVKLMHDGKLYKQFGFQNFEEYCKSKGFSDRYGRQLVKIAGMLEQEQNRNPGSGFGNLSLTVLKLLAPLEPEQREQLAQTVDLENISKRDLEKEIKELKARHKQELEAEKVKTEALKRDKENAYSELGKTEQCLIESRAREERLRNENAEKDLQIQELENRPVEVMQSVEELKRIKELENQNELIANENSELEAENMALQRQLAEAQTQTADAGAEMLVLSQIARTALENLMKCMRENPDTSKYSPDYFKTVINRFEQIEKEQTEKKSV